MTDIVAQPDRASHQRVILAALAKYEAADALLRTSVGGAAHHWDEQCEGSLDVIREEIEALGEIGVAILIPDLAGGGNG